MLISKNINEDVWINRNIKVFSMIIPQIKKPSIVYFDNIDEIIFAKDFHQMF